MAIGIYRNQVGRHDKKWQQCVISCNIPLYKLCCGGEVEPGQPSVTDKALYTRASVWFSVLFVFLIYLIYFLQSRNNLFFCPFKNLYENDAHG